MMVFFILPKHWWFLCFIGFKYKLIYALWFSNYSIIKISEVPCSPIELLIKHFIDFEEQEMNMNEHK